MNGQIIKQFINHIVEASSTPVKERDLESDREISPKLVVGTKKYGRRSRPAQHSEDLIDNTSDSDNENAVVPSIEQKPSKVQRSASQSDIHGAKRKRLYSSKLKRCASLPSDKPRPEIKTCQLQLDFNEDSMDDEQEYPKVNSLFENLQAVCNSLETGVSSTLNFQQLEIVCERVGLHKIAAKFAAQEVFEKLSVRRDDEIRFDEFMNLIQSDSDMFSAVENIGQMTEVNFKKMEERQIEDDDSQTYQNIIPTWSLETGTTSLECLIDLWESAGITDAEKLIHHFGFSGKEVKLHELCSMLDEEILRHSSDKTMAIILKASLSLHKAEITSLRHSFRQLSADNQKLFTDNKEANRRASLLAQEIDERHTNLEDSARTEIKSIEQRNNETIRELTNHLSLEREHLGSLNAKLEAKIKSMEADEQKLHQELLCLKDENSALEMEQVDLHKQITQLLEQNIKLNQDIADMEAGGIEDGKIDSHNEEMLDLIEKIEILQMENSNLRDKNDELLTDIENLNMEVIRSRSKNKVMTRDNHEDLEGTSSMATKRRGDSPSKFRMIEESPRMGKVRKFSNDVEESDASGDWMALNTELASSTPNTLKVISHEAPGDNVDVLKNKVFELEERVVEYRRKLKALSAEETAVGEENIAILKAENEHLTIRYKEMQDNLEQMSKEYENCEDYWQLKLNEERLLFDEDQRQSEEKFAELLQKMSELTDQFAAAQTEKNSGRLTPIDEKCHLESQYLELENEMDLLKVHAQSLLDDKSREIEDLKREITKIQNESVMKTPPRGPSPDNASVASSPINYLLNQNTITGPIRDYQNPNWTTKNIQQETREESTIANEQLVDARVISPIQKPQSSQLQSTIPDISAPNQKEILEVCEALSAISGISVASNINHSLQDFNESASNVKNVSNESITKMKIIMDQMKEEVQELTVQRESLLMELQQLQEARPILANAYASFEIYSSHAKHRNYYLFFILLENNAPQSISKT